MKFLRYHIPAWQRCSCGDGAKGPRLFDTGPGLSAWKPFRTGETAQRLAPGPGGITAIDLAAAHHCDLWATVTH